MPATEPEQQDTSKTAAEIAADKRSPEQKQIDIIGDAVADLDERFNALTNFLEIRIAKNFKKYDVSLKRRVLHNPDGMATPPKKKWYQFWK